MTEADLRRVTSDLYYALFHRICEALVAPLGADPDNPAFIEAYKNLYRQPDHSHIEKKCKELKRHNFSEPVNRFAEQFVALKNKRENADYDPLAKFAISSVRMDIQSIESVISDFDNAEPSEQTHFAYFVSLKQTRRMDG